MATGHLAPARANWLALSREEAIDPDLPICDAHHHLWDHGPGDIYLAGELLADAGSGHHIVSTAYVDCFSKYRASGPDELKPVGETEWVDALTAESASTSTRIAAGIVGNANLMLGTRAGEVLDAHMAASTRFRGVRHWLNWDANTDAMGLRSDAPPRLAYEIKFREGIKELAKRNLSFDAWMYFPQLPDLVDLACAIPEVTIVLNHVGGLLGLGPYSKRDEAFALWHRNMTELARCPNVCVKLGGMGVPRCGFAWHQRDKPPSSEDLASAFSPYCLAAIELFGAERCMFESNFPPDKAAYTYTAIWNAFKRIARCCSTAERADLFHDTAQRVYRLSQDE
ncbi:MAG: amidohydrolase family protein [Burkholderiales bacterium]